MTTLKAEKRSMDVKAKRLRREGFVTGNVFGHAIEGSIPVKMNSVDAERLLKTEHKGGQINLDIEGQVYDVLIKEVDYNAMTRKIDEIDFQALVSTEKVTSTAEIVILNREAVIGGVLQEDLSEVAHSDTLHKCMDICTTWDLIAVIYIDSRNHILKQGIFVQAHSCCDSFGHLT